MGRQIDRSEIIDYDEKYETVTAASEATTEILSFRCKPGKKPYLIFLGNAISSGGGDYVKFQLQVNRGPFHPFAGDLNQWAPPESNYELPVPYELPVGSEVRVVAISTGSAGTYSATARVKVVYVDFERPDVYR